MLLLTQILIHSSFISFLLVFHHYYFFIIIFLSFSVNKIIIIIIKIKIVKNWVMTVVMSGLAPIDYSLFFVSFPSLSSLDYVLAMQKIISALQFFFLLIKSFFFQLQLFYLH